MEMWGESAPLAAIRHDMSVATGVGSCRTSQWQTALSRQRLHAPCLLSCGLTGLSTSLLQFSHFTAFIQRDTLGSGGVGGGGKNSDYWLREVWSAEVFGNEPSQSDWRIIRLPVKTLSMSYKPERKSSSVSWAEVWGNDGSQLSNKCLHKRLPTQMYQAGCTQATVSLATCTWTIFLLCDWNNPDWTSIVYIGWEY